MNRPPRRILTSVRLRLTVWNVGVLALVLVVFAGSLGYIVRVSLAAAVDQDLSDSAHGVITRWSRFPAPGGGGSGVRFPIPPGFRNPPGGGPGATPVPPAERPPVPRAFSRVQSHPEPDTSQLSNADRRWFFRRPRMLNLDGQSMVPFVDDEPWDRDSFLVSAAGREQYSTIFVDREPVRIFSAPLWRDLEVEGVVQVAHPLTEMNHLNAGLLGTLLMLIPLALAAAGLGGAFLTDRALRPVRDVTQAAAQIGAQDLSRRLSVTGHDEISELAKTFNGMIGRLEEAFRKLETAYEQQRRFTADASHELRTPLTSLKANTSLALCGERSPEAYREAIAAADEAADTMTRIVQDLLLLARSDSGQLVLELHPTPIGEVIQRIAAAAADPESARLDVDLADRSAGVMADPHHLRRLFGNLVQNALRHTPASGLITLSVRTREDIVEVRVRDTGEGIAPEHLPHVSERFYRVDAARSRARGGSGLGLSICQSIVAAHSGTMEIRSEVGIGTEVIVRLPRADLPEVEDYDLMPVTHLDSPAPLSPA